jgi:hypothetical protein
MVQAVGEAQITVNDYDGAGQTENLLSVYSIFHI